MVKGKTSKKIAVLVGSVFILFVLLIFLWVLSWSKPWVTNELPDGVPDSLLSAGVKCTLEKETYSSVIPEIKMIVTNTNGYEVSSGPPTRLEVLIQGKWYQVPVIGDSFQPLGCLIEPDRPWETSVEIYRNFGKLPKGHYRCLKEVNNERDWTTYAYAEFDVVLEAGWPDLFLNKMDSAGFPHG